MELVGLVLNFDSFLIGMIIISYVLQLLGHFSHYRVAKLGLSPLVHLSRASPNFLAGAV